MNDAGRGSRRPRVWTVFVAYVLAAGVGIALGWTADAKGSLTGSNERQPTTQAIGQLLVASMTCVLCLALTQRRLRALAVPAVAA
jgi:hypothetical protein